MLLASIPWNMAGITYICTKMCVCVCGCVYVCENISIYIYMLYILFCIYFCHESYLASWSWICFSNVLPGDWIQLAWFFMPNWFRGPLSIGNDFHLEPGTPPPRVQTPLRPSGTENGNSLEKGVNIQTYRHRDVDIDIVYIYIYIDIYIYTDIGHTHTYIYILYICVCVCPYDDQAQSASTEDASVEALCHHFFGRNI